ncbi:HD domain-containing protein [Salinispira pacifica]|uniref:tRNA nucleotidyltransferase n=1 Tax=Salinispira pacifica TaxID=1307761 RepID=V5WD62_9SPIO|nr:HD domain-containing protein [Salinispira pacifica]AHC13520.1 tRNA nucleotidyltransferase [Salinispira pacifica]
METSPAAPDQDISSLLDSSNISWSWVAFSALDRYYRGRNRATSFGQVPRSIPHETILVHGDLPDLAKTGIPLEFPGIEGVDAAAWNGRGRSWFIFTEAEENIREMPEDASQAIEALFGFPGEVPGILNALHRPRHFHFPGNYHWIKDRSFVSAIRSRLAELHSPMSSTPPELRVLFSAAIILSRYGTGAARFSSKRPLADSLSCPDIGDSGEKQEYIQSLESEAGRLSPEYMRVCMELILSGPAADLGLDLLHCAGVFSMLFPALADMDATEQAKDHHPEGNVWRHSLESMKYRKTPDLRLAYALLLHDAGKPDARPKNGKRFHNHAQLGGDIAKKLLAEIGVDQQTIEDTVWLIEHHMYPPALSRLPDRMRDPVMADPRFPLLLELYRCDISASFSGPQRYYQACDIYNRYRKDRGLGKWRGETLSDQF